MPTDGPDDQYSDQLGLPALKEGSNRNVSQIVKDVQYDNSSGVPVTLDPVLELEEAFLSDPQNWGFCIPEDCALASNLPDLATVFDNDVLRMPQVCLEIYTSKRLHMRDCVFCKYVGGSHACCAARPRHRLQPNRRSS